MSRRRLRPAFRSDDGLEGLFEGGDASEGLHAQRRGITCDVGFARALEAWHPPVERRNQVAQVLDQLQSGGG